MTKTCNSGPAANQQWAVSSDGEMKNVATGRYVQYFTNAYTGKPYLGPRSGSTSTVLIGGKYRWNAGTSITATSLGAYTLKAEPGTGDAFTPGSAGVVSFDSQTTSGATGVTLRTGDELTWTIQLPPGLVADVPADESSATYRTTYSLGAGNVLTKKITRTGGDITGAFASNTATRITVTATNQLVDKAPVTVTFTPTSGFESSHASSTTTVSVGEVTPPIDDPVTLTNPSDVSAGFTPNQNYPFRGTAPVGTTVDVVGADANGRVYAKNIPVNTTTGTWEWTNTIMGTYTWNLNFIAHTTDGNTRGQAELRGFRPNS